MSNAIPTVFQADYVSGLFGMQMRNMEALSTARQKLLEGLGMLAKQQSQTMQNSMRRALDTTQAAPRIGGVRELIGTSIDDLKSSILDAQANSNAISEIMMRSLGDLAGTLQTRMLAAMDEFKTLVVANGPSLSLPDAAGPPAMIQQ